MPNYVPLRPLFGTSYFSSVGVVGGGGVEAYWIFTSELPPTAPWLPPPYTLPRTWAPS